MIFPRPRQATQAIQARPPSMRANAQLVFLRLITAVLISLIPSFCFAETKRVVIIRVDGLPYGLLDSFAKERDQHTGKSRLPWIDHVFYQRGARLSSFYTRGMSLSAPSWSL